jgi:endonuclease YncB( thermonuclease family)
MKIAILALIGFCVAVVIAITLPSASYGKTISGCHVVDGDTLRCGPERVRLLGIDAPELPGHCAQGRACAPGDPYASTASLEEATSETMQIERVGTDRYGRTLAMVKGSHGDLSCWQLRHHAAIYKPGWDNGFRVARTCPGASVG